MTRPRRSRHPAARRDEQRSLKGGAENRLLEQTTIYVDHNAFQKILDWMDAPPTKEEIAGMKRLASSKIW
jgi:uncharacterized protein (DUF1778 family)